MTFLTPFGSPERAALAAGAALGFVEELNHEKMMKKRRFA